MSRLRAQPPAATVPGVSADPRIDALMEMVAGLAATVGQLAETVALQAGAASAPPAPGTRDLSHIVFTQTHGYAPLVPVAEAGEEAEYRRYRLAKALNIIGSHAGQELIEHGARGFYRKLQREEGQVQLNIPPNIARLLIEDACTEDEAEGREMSEDLLKVWSPTPPPDANIDPATVSMDPSGNVIQAIELPPKFR